MNLTKTAFAFLLAVASTNAYSTVSTHNVNSLFLIAKHSPLFVKPGKTFSKTRLYTKPEDAEIIKKEEVSSITLLQRIESAGKKLKPLALEAKQKSVAAAEKDDKPKSVIFTLQSCALFSLFILYRGYRGFFVIIPEVFRQTYAKMKIAVQDPFDDEEVASMTGDGNTTVKKHQPLRTTVTVSVLTALVTASYIVSGLFKVVKMFLRTAWGTSSIETSFEAAADEMIETENRVSRISMKNKGINGENLSDYAP
mmetsp:Transcript_17034/g.16458  ORF Transcript_17034/g.16458 Transcript_17034/m.16458 type:complete len:253 (-) Transcript_17034:346-1104(-)|eukprot:CAMPEP_0197831042 /NCGR_PEP_ID=MMETSP1437-20131217/7642_1 /TAXON_ID=49252 ORGANISM="Eucampia antarctica, Strain CCMP1452" /NCGR_SAMPLE_ID=MMETSP1437 /ASSEMBLY_ACC=CAM_ASM_001096 /LENGTH=252 /DNA_ID=CAMNT_0043433783 /DNA_START=126 /DNA_END=884 /DNA_ORIENTATION=+